VTDSLVSHYKLSKHINTENMLYLFNQKLFLIHFANITLEH